jgi:hypothetical protein
MYPRRKTLEYKDVTSERKAEYEFYVLDDAIDAVEYALKVVSLETPITKK